jgi:2-keto-myo-inositol isomerase
MHPISRREFVAVAGVTPLLLPAITEAQARSTTPTRPFVCMHEFASNTFDFRTAMEGYSKAGVRAVEIVLAKAREFADRNSPAAARRLLDDLGLRAVSTSNHTGAIEPTADRAKNLDDLKAKCEFAQILGADKLVVVPAMRTTPTEDDYKRGVQNLREAADVSGHFNVSLLVEFSKFFTFANSLSTAVQLVRAANHPHARVMIDTYHFWIGVSKFEDLEQLHDGEVVHVHFEDTPAEPVRELLEQRHRVLPGQGIAPLRRILDVLKRKKYAGALSVELMDPAFQTMDPYQLALKVRAAVEPMLT